MNVYDEYMSHDFSYVLKKALLIYRSKNGALCTVNNFIDGEIQPGAPITPSVLAELLEEIKNDDSGKNKKLFRWQDPRLLASGGGEMLWYSPAVRREIFFSCGNKKLMKISGMMFPFPALLFYARKGNLNVYCLKTSRRPTEKTKLWEAPFWNMNSAGKVCLPMVSRDRTCSIDEWENIFYNSAFSHAWGAKLKKGKIENIFPKLVKKDAVFPLDLLQESNISIKNIMEGNVK